MSTLGKLLSAAAVTLVVAAAAGCSDASSDSAAPTPTATVTVTASASASPTPSPSPTSVAPTSVAPDPAPDLSQPPTTYAEAVARIDAARDVTPAPAATLPTFTSPSGNIFCDLNLPACEIGDGKVDDPGACSGGMTTQVGRIELQGNQPVAVCNTDTIVQPDAPELAYGTSVTTRDTRCVSEKVGITCVARGAQTGFFLARGRYLLITS